LFRVEGSGLRASGLGCRVEVFTGLRDEGSGLGVEGLRFWVCGFGVGFEVKDLGFMRFRIDGWWFIDYGLWCMVYCS